MQFKTILFIIMATGFARSVMGCQNTIANRKALIFGITGQDGSYLAEFLLQKGYEVHGVIRRASSKNTYRIEHLIDQKKCAHARSLTLHYGDLTDSSNVIRILAAVRPHEIYNLAAQSHVKVSFEQPEHTGDVDALGTLRILEAIRITGLTDQTKFYQASTSELYGKVQEIPQTETTPFYPRSPYAVSKLYAFWITKNYREAYGIYACNGILFNHESPRRGETFVTRKITLAAAHRSMGNKEILLLGNLDASRDWGYAQDYVEAMWLMLQQPHPEDFVIATGQTHTVREFIEVVYKEIGIEIEWRNAGIEEIGLDKITGEIIIKIDPTYFRPAEVDYLVGNASKAHIKLGWQPKTSFEQLAKLMIREDKALVEHQKASCLFAADQMH